MAKNANLFHGNKLESYETMRMYRLILIFVGHVVSEGTLSQIAAHIFKTSGSHFTYRGWVMYIFGLEFALPSK